MGITRQERQKHRPTDSRGRRAGRRPEEEERREEEEEELIRDGVKGRIALLAILEGNDGESETGEAFPAGQRDGAEGQQSGEGTHKTGKHVISPRRGEKTRPRKISRRLVLLPSLP